MKTQNTMSDTKHIYLAICDAGDEFSEIVTNPSEHSKKADETTAGNVGYRYFPMERVKELCFGDEIEIRERNQQLEQENKELKADFADLRENKEYVDRMRNQQESELRTLKNKLVEQTQDDRRIRDKKLRGY